MEYSALSLEECIEQLEERAKPSKNDIGYEKYTKYVNCFVSKFGKERVYLVGSTGERSKLAYSKDDGDADFLLVSGKLEIPTKNIEFHERTPCYARILVDDNIKSIGIKVVDNKYISANALRELRPELFTLLRAVYLQITATVDKLPENDSDVTVVSVSSKVGLQLTTYRSLQFQKDFDLRRRHLQTQNKVSLEQERRDLIAKRWENVKFHEQDTRIYRRLHKMLQLAIPHTTKGEKIGGIALFARFLDDVLKRQSLDFTTDTDTHSMDENATHFHKDEKPYTLTSNQSNSNTQPSEMMFRNEIRATFKGKHLKDFVPALIIEGEKEFMKQWQERVMKLNWPVTKVNDILKADVFVVARAAPINPNADLDFCLSFNLAEQIIVRWMSSVQRKVFMILKAFLKGIFEQTHRESGIELKLKTYHIKTLLFWLYEPLFFKDTGSQSVQIALDTALESLREKLLEEELSHYFVHSNLFADFGKTDFKILIRCVDEVKNDPVFGLNYYIEMKDGMYSQVWFTEEELGCILEMHDDGGRSKHINRLEDAMIDFLIGVNESKRDGDGNSPLKEAIADTLKLYLTEDGTIDCTLFKIINDFLTNGETDLSKLDRSSASKKVADIAELIEGLGNVNTKIARFLNKFGGKKCIIEILQGVFHGKAIDFSRSLAQQIIETVDRYLACSDDEEDTLASELKYKVAGHFLCRTESLHTSFLRNV